MELHLQRDVLAQDFTLGTFSVDGTVLGYTCEDTDRHLENGGTKVDGRTAIPRGRYEVILSFSNRFQKIMPEVLHVPGYAGVRIHGGNTAADTLGCPLLGEERTTNGVHNCAVVNLQLIELLRHAEERGEEIWLTVE